MKVILAALGFLLVMSGCDDVIVVFNTGTIIGGPICRDGDGTFDLEEQGGLVLLVVITDDTQIFLSTGETGVCTDLTVGTHVQVRGDQQGTTLSAQSVQVT
jgi:hypothetical protein